MPSHPGVPAHPQRAYQIQGNNQREDRGQYYYNPPIRSAYARHESSWRERANDVDRRDRVSSRPLSPRKEYHKFKRDDRASSTVRGRQDQRKDRSASSQPIAQRKPAGGPPNPDGYINTISGGPAIGGFSTHERKRYAREARHPLAVYEVARASSPHIDICFGSRDAEGVRLPHADPLVVHLQISTKMVKRILVDTGASVDILSWDAFNQLAISPNMLKPYQGKLITFAGDEVDVAGLVELQVTMGEIPRRRAEFIEFTVVRCPTTYNAIMGRASLVKFQAVISLYHLKLKFPTSAGVGEVRGLQEEARSCYLVASKSRHPACNMVVATADEDARPPIQSSDAELATRTIIPRVQGSREPTTWNDLPRVLQTKILYLLGKRSNFDFEGLTYDRELLNLYYATIKYHGYPSILEDYDPPYYNWRLMGPLYQGHH